ncbi:hypothetical protein MVEN_02448300 [Mycena venus]|uniref:Uncharacterized protein n=1 Tax=Mycena venus TaxID=2733690 RepID=A0A8H6WYL0_9AGAR|nr:hypothetical protein MVEN_02448300 [Mycena venus]
MLQIPSSILSLVSLSSKGFFRIFGGLCIGTQIAVTLVLSSSKIEHTAVRATKTHAVELVPTRCVLSNGTISSPYVATMGYAAVIFASLFCILLAKGFTSSRPPNPDDHGPDFSSSFDRGATFAQTDTGSQPPSPPSDPGSSRNANQGRRRNPCCWFLWLFLILLALVPVGVYVFAIYYARSQPLPPSLLAFKSFVNEGLRWVQMGIPDFWASAATSISALTSHLVLRARQYSKILLIALTSHCACMLLSLALYGLRKRIMAFVQRKWFLIFCFVVPITAIGSCSTLNWLFWLHYYIGCGNYGYPPVRRINQSLERLLYQLSTASASPSLGILMFLGPLVLYGAAMCLSTVLAIFFSFPSSTRALVRRLSHRRLLKAFSHNCTILVIWWFKYTVFAFLFVQFLALQPDARRNLYRSLFCPESRAKTLRLFWFLLRRYQTWKSLQINAFSTLLSRLQRAFVAGIAVSWEIWKSLSFMQKLLIAAPAVIFYTYHDIVSPSTPRRCLSLTRAARCPLHAGCGQFLEAGNVGGHDFFTYISTSLLLPLHDSVKNRLAARSTVIFDAQMK